MKDFYATNQRSNICFKYLSCIDAVFDREQRSKVLKEAFVVVVVKNVLGNKKCASVTHCGSEL